MARRLLVDNEASYLANVRGWPRGGACRATVGVEAAGSVGSTPRCRLTVDGGCQGLASVASARGASPGRRDRRVECHDGHARSRAARRRRGDHGCVLGGLVRAVTGRRDGLHPPGRAAPTLDRTDPAGGRTAAGRCGETARRLRGTSKKTFRATGGDRPGARGSARRRSRSGARSRGTRCQRRASRAPRGSGSPARAARGRS